MNLTLEVARIILRYGAGFLIAKGVVSPEVGAAITGDPHNIEMVMGVVTLVVTEAGFVVAKLRNK